MKNYVKYDPNTGRVYLSGQVPDRIDPVVEQAEEGMAVLVGEGMDTTHYVDLIGPTLVPRPEIQIDKQTIAPDGVDTATVSGLPDPCRVQIDGEAYEVTGGTLELQTDQPGAYTIKITDDDAFPAQAFQTQVTAR